MWLSPVIEEISYKYEVYPLGITAILSHRPFSQAQRCLDHQQSITSFRHSEMKQIRVVELTWNTEFHPSIKN